MAYKRQTSFSPFSSKRSVPNKDAKDQITLAKALDSQRKQSVKEFAGASSQQIEELGRIDKIARQKDEYEIKELAKFSQALTSALETGSKVLGKQYIDSQQAKGADAFADEPFDAFSIEQEISSLRDKNLTILDEIEKSENKKRILNLEEKIKLHESRMKRGAWGVGYTKAYLQEVGNGFLPHLSQTVASDDSWFKEPDIDPITLEPIEGTGIKFSEYFAQDLDTKKEMEQTIFARYKEKHNLDGVNKKYINTYLNEPAAKILNKWSANELNKSIIENAEKELNGFSNDLVTVIADFKFTEIPAEVTDPNAEGYDKWQDFLKLKTAVGNNIQYFLNHVPTAFNNRGVPEGSTANSATSDLLRTTLIDALVDLPSDVSRDTLLDLILGDEERGIQPMKFKTSIGLVPLTEFAQFDKDDVEAAMNKVVADKYKAKVENEELIIEGDFRKAIAEYNSDGDVVKLNEAFLAAKNNEHYIPGTNFGNKIDGLYKGALTRKNRQLNDEESKKAVKKLRNDGYQVIPMRIAVAEGINFKTIKENQEKGIIQVPGQNLYLDENRDVVADYSEKITATFLDKATGGHSSDKDYIISNSLYIKAAEELSTKELLLRSNYLLNDATWRAKYPNITDSEELRGYALEDAFEEIIQIIPTLDTIDKGDTWLGNDSGRDYTLELIDNKSGLTKFKNQASWLSPVNEKIEENADGLATHVDAYFDKDGFTTINDGGILSSYDIPVETKTAILNPPTVTIDGNEVYNDFPEFTMIAAREDATGVSALQIWNAERKTMNLPEITIDQLAPHLQKVAQVENLLSRNDKIDIQNGKVEDVIDRSGLISISYLSNAFKNEFNEGNFKIDGLTVKKYADELGIDYSFLYKKDGSINPDAEVLWDNINRHHVNNLLVKSTKDVNNKQEALQNFFALASGKSKNYWKDNIVFEAKGVEFFKDYNSNGATLANYDVAYNIMSDTELSVPLKNFKKFNGKNYKLSELEGTINKEAIEIARLEKEAFDKINKEEGFEAAYEFATRNLKVNTVENLTKDLEELRNDTENVNFDTRSRQNYNTASYTEWYNGISKKQSQINIVSLLSGGQGDINWGLQQSIDSRRNTTNYLNWVLGAGSKIFPPTWTTDYRVVSDIVNVIGPERWEEIKIQAAKNAEITAPPESFQMKFIPGSIKEPMEESFVDEVYKLIIMEPEFYIGEFIK
tara:strand:- start:279 stop:3863 length:3585 start_codon:yes stop_codon:yes gene_type:complete